jgi:hypothetical protein
MTVQLINKSSLRLEESTAKKDPWAILSVLALVRGVLAKGQEKIVQTTSKLVETGNQIQDKQSRDLKEASKINLEVLEKELKSEVFRDIAIALAIVSIVAAPVLGKLGTFLASLARPASLAARYLPAFNAMPQVIAMIGIGLGVKGSFLKIDAAEKRQELAKVEEHTKVDAAITNSNLRMINFAASTGSETAKVVVSAQNASTEIINSTGAAQRSSIR